MRVVIVEVQVTWWAETHFFVPSVHDVEGPRSQGIARYRVWTAHELATLLQGSERVPQDLRLVMVVRREFDGEVVEARPRRAS